MTDGHEHLTGIPIKGHTMYVDRRDARGQALEAAGGVLHQGALELWQLLLTDGPWSAVIDVGSNYGEMVLGVALPGGARVVAVEPNPRVLPALRRSLRESLPDAAILPSAIGHREGTTVLYDDNTWWGNSTLCERWTADRPDHDWRERRVASITLESVIAGLGLEPRASVAIKLDIEGMEATVLQHSMPTFVALGRVGLMLEVVRFGKSDLSWLLQMFNVWVLDQSRSALRPFVGSQPDDLLAMLEEASIYRRDIIAVPRPVK